MLSGLTDSNDFNNDSADLDGNVRFNDSGSYFADSLTTLNFGIAI